jgi:lipopolysaccharide transport system permease protein
MRLAVDFAKRDFRERYVGTGLGQLWYVLSPLITIFIYTVIFSDFMKMKLDVVDSSYAYSIYLVPGLLAWTSFSTIITRLNSSILDRAGLIKKISVPVYVFQLSIVMTEFLLFCIAISLGIGFLLLVGHPVTWSFLWMVPMMGLMTLFAFGLGAILSLFTPFFKDMKEAVPIVLQLLFWGTPIIYMKSMIYDKYPAIVDFNPLYLFIESLQNIFLFSKGPEFGTLAAGFVTAFILLAAAARLYKKMIGTIKDIL